MSTSADRTYEEQNDASLNKLFDKVKALVSTCTSLCESQEHTTDTNSLYFYHREELQLIFIMMQNLKHKDCWEMHLKVLIILQQDYPIQVQDLRDK